MKTQVAGMALVLFTLAPAIAAERQPPAAAVSPDEAAQLAAVGVKGRMIYAIDRAGWLSTDVMQEKLPNAVQKEVRGWIVELSGSRMSALYYGLKDGLPYGVFVVEFSEGKVESSRQIDGASSPLSPFQLNMIRAREAAGGSKVEGCGAPFNTVVIPPLSATSPVHVYLLTPQTKQGVFPAGRHMLLIAHTDGKFSGRAFTSSCLNIGAPPAKAGEKPVGMFVTHFLDPKPTEIHVLLSIQSRMPVYVSTAEPKQLWKVDGPRISRAKAFGE